MENLGRIIASFFGGVILLIVLILILQGTSFQQTETGMAINPVVNDLLSPAVSIGYYNMEEELSKNSVVQALPDNSVLLLKFYNFNSGERAWEKAYIIKKGVATETSNFDEKADVTLFIHSKYLQELTNKNFCEITKKANQNGDLGSYTELSSMALAWKFKSMYKYKDCIGI